MSRSAAAGLLLALLSRGAAGQGATARFEVELDAQSARVLTAREGVVPPSRTVALGGVAVRLRPSRSPYRFGLQLHRATQENDLAFGEVGMARAFGSLAAELGLGWRSGYDAGSGELHGASHRFVRVGAAWGTAFSATPLSLQARAGTYLPLAEATLPGGALAGWEGETALRLSLGGWPVDAVMAFRFERFSVERAVQEVSEVRIGMAWRGGGR